MAFNPRSGQNGYPNAQQPYAQGSQTGPHQQVAPSYSPQPYSPQPPQSGYPAVQGYTYPAAPSSSQPAFQMSPFPGYPYPSAPSSGQPAFQMSPVPGYIYPAAPNLSPAAFPATPPYYGQYPNPPHSAFPQSAYPAPPQPVYVYPSPPSSNPNTLFASPPQSVPSPQPASSPTAIASSHEDDDYRRPSDNNIPLDTIIKKKPSTQEKHEKTHEQAWIARYKGSMFSPATPITVDNSRRIPGVLVDKINFRGYQECQPTPEQILYYLDDRKPLVHYKYLDVLDNEQKGTIPLIDVNSKYKGVSAQTSSSSAGSTSKLYVDLNQELKEPIWKRIQKSYIEGLELKEIRANAAPLPAPGEVLYSVTGSDVECQYWVLEDSKLSLIKKRYTKEDFYRGSGEAEILSRISAQVKLIFDLAEYLRTNKQEEESDLKKAKASVAEKLIGYLKDRANAEVPTFTQEEIDSIYSGFWSSRLGDLVDRAKAIYPSLKYELKPAQYAPS